MNTDHFRIPLPDGSYMFVKDLPWYKKDRYGWPIEVYKGKPIKSFIRIIFKNFRKII